MQLTAPYRLIPIRTARLRILERRRRCAINEAEAGTVVFVGGPRNGETDTVDHRAVVIGTGKEGGVYERTGERRDDLSVYRWRSLTEAQIEALVRGDLRANQEPES